MSELVFLKRSEQAPESRLKRWDPNAVWLINKMCDMKRNPRNHVTKEVKAKCPAVGLNKNTRGIKLL